MQKLVHGPIYVCTADTASIECPNDLPFRHAVFQGPHPAGLPGTHIHFLEPVSESKTVWHIGYQDVMAMARLFTTGRLPVERIVAIGGPMIESPRLVRTRLGANTSELIDDSLRPGDVRVISGSVLSGHRASGWARYLGRYHQQVAVLQEGNPRESGPAPASSRPRGRLSANCSARATGLRRRKTAAPEPWYRSAASSR